MKTKAPPKKEKVIRRIKKADKADTVVSLSNEICSLINRRSIPVDIAMSAIATIFCNGLAREVLQGNLDLKDATLAIRDMDATMKRIIKDPPEQWTRLLQ